jgi:CHC2-type zinc finger protein
MTIKEDVLTEVYTDADTLATVRPERRGVSRRSVIEDTKAKVATIDLADRLCGPGQMRKVGKEWAALCPLPDHQERTPSFTVDPAKDVWFCHGCLRGGDVITLAQRAWDIDRADVAAAELLLAFGHEVPPRPPAWAAKQDRQASARQVLEDAKIAHLQRRVFRRFMTLLESIEDEQERREEAEHLWEAAREIAVLIWAGRRAA